MVGSDQLRRPYQTRPRWLLQRGRPQSADSSRGRSRALDDNATSGANEHAKDLLGEYALTYDETIYYRYAMGDLPLIISEHPSFDDPTHPHFHESALHSRLARDMPRCYCFFAQRCITKCQRQSCGAYWSNVGTVVGGLLTSRSLAMLLSKAVLGPLPFNQTMTTPSGLNATPQV